MGDLHPDQVYLDHESATLPLSTNKLSAMRAEAESQGLTEGETEKKASSGAGAAASVVLSFVYAKLVLVACIAFLLAEIATFKIPLFFFEGFFSYLYGAGILFFLYAFSCLLGGPGTAKRSRKVASGSKLTVNLFQPGQSGTYNVAEYNKDQGEDGGMLKARGQKDPGALSPSQLEKSESSRSLRYKPDCSHGSVFLRLGALLFGLGTLVYCAFELVGALLEIPRTSPCYDLITGINPALQMGFTFLQMVFIFVNAKLNISKFKVVARLGLMHLIAANVCVWMRTIAREGLKDFTRYYVKHSGGPSEDQMILNRVNLSAISTSRQSQDSDSDNSPYGDDGNGQESAGIINNNNDGLINGTVCERLSILGTLRDDTAPYLYPVVVQYSFVAAVVLFVIWLDVGRYPKYAPEAEDSGDVEPQQAPAAAPPPPRQTGPVQTDGDAEAEEEDGPSGPRACAGARKGLVFGLLLVLCAVAATVCYFVLLENAELKMYAIYLADSAHTALLLISLLVVLIGCCRVKKLKFDPHKEDLLNVLLLRVSGFAVLLYATVTIIAAALRFLNPALDVPTLLVLVTAALTVLEIAFQAPFVLDANKRAIHKQTLNETKPGRQLITFLLLTNLAMFAIYIVEAQKVDRLPVQLNFYGYLTWTVILKLVLPLCIFHRFHGAAILAEIWRNSYRTLPE